jgi:hypothetical protein
MKRRAQTLQALINAIRSGSPEGGHALESWLDDGGSDEDIRTVLEAAFDEGRAVREVWDLAFGTLLGAVAPYLEDDELGDLEERYSAFSEPARASAITVLWDEESEAAAALLARLVHAHGWPAPLLCFGGPAIPEIVLPALLDRGIPGLTDDEVLRRIAVSAREVGVLPAEVEEPTLRLVRATLDGLPEPDASAPGHRWRYRSPYFDTRGAAENAVQLLGYLPWSSAVESETERVRGHVDPRLRMQAIIARARHGLEPSQDEIASVAADPDTRSMLHGDLAELGHVDWMPADERTPIRLAESMVYGYLALEHGSGPIALEPHAMFRDPGDDPALHMVFRFRTGDPDGTDESTWMLAACLDYGPSTTAQVFSIFAPLDEGDPRDGVPPDAVPVGL